MKRALPLLLLCVAANAAEVRVPSAPPPTRYDSDRVTNALLWCTLESDRFLRVGIGLTDFPSDNAEVAFEAEAR